MHNGSLAWIFGLLFLAAFCFLAYNSFELRLMTGKTGETMGVVTRTEAIPVRVGYKQIVRYTFTIEGKQYEGSRTIGKRFGPQKVGNGVQVKYLIRNPENNKPIAFYVYDKTKSAPEESQ